MKLSEHQIQQQILDYLRMKRIPHIRINSGGILSTHKGKNYMVRLAKKGSPDIVCCVNGMFVAIEVKSERGIQSQEQHEFEEEIMETGGLYILARSLLAVMKEIEDFGKVGKV